MMRMVVFGLWPRWNSFALIGFLFSSSCLIGTPSLSLSSSFPQITTSTSPSKPKEPTGSPEIKVYTDMANVAFLRQILVPLKSSLTECSGIETFEKVSGVEVLAADRIPLYSSSNGAITADCYNRCRSSSSCSAFWIDYNSSSCFRLANPKFTDGNFNVQVDKAFAYFERICLQGDICSKAWVTERLPGYELAGYDDVIIRSVSSRKRCSELCLLDKRLPCRSADFWEGRKECRLSREDRRSQPGAFVKTSSEVEYIENTCVDPVASNKGRECEWEIMDGHEFIITDFSAKATTLLECQKTCETYGAFTCRSVTYDKLLGICSLSGSDLSTTSTKLLRVKDHKVYAQRVPCIDMSLECNGESMIAKLKSHSPFYGKLFSIGMMSSESKASHPLGVSECEAFGHGKLVTTLEYPLDRCGVYKDADGSFVGNLIVQQHPLIMKRGDAGFKLVCSFPELNRTLTHTIGFEKESESRLVEASAIPSPGGISGISTSVLNSTAKSPSVSLRILDKNGNDITGVSLGDELYLKIEVEQNSAYGVFARDLVAKSGRGDEELVLLDSRGCPEDPAIFPHLRRDDEAKSLKGRFEAFKFTSDAVVRFQVHLQFCRNNCGPIRCDGENSLGRKKRRKREGVVGPVVVELQKEIIVTAQKPNPIKTHHFIHQPSSGSLINLEMGSQTHPSSSLSINPSSSKICTSKPLFVGLIFGFCILQILIVVSTALCVCQKGKDKKVNGYGLSGAGGLNGGRMNSELYYARPSTVFSTLRSLRTNLRD